VVVVVVVVALPAAVELALLAGVPPPAAGRSGSDTSMYTAPAEVGSASTATAAVHFAGSRCESPK
jgi:hypothetical protein